MVISSVPLEIDFEIEICVQAIIRVFPGTSVKVWGSKIIQEKINCKPVAKETSMDFTWSSEARLIFPGL